VGKILITAPGKFTGAELKTGTYYNAEPAAEGTDAQNKTFHELIKIYFDSQCYSYPAKNEGELKKEIKKHLGRGYERWVFVQDTEEGLIWGEVKRLEEVPENVAIDKYGKELLRGELYSWADYNKTQRARTITSLINEMIVAGVNSRKFEEMLREFEANSMRAAG
jgi:hypothetical protein